ncbi:DUF4912 domain-containing protein [Leptolyngbyaceae cyanobacterium CCMR0082]|uniref:DUF4912 domain-containing protein n=1 Tax=Adonisia turfae CCMR0082 TaxID=2304604 RepID=A0A6M0S1Z0_9CYAN|nr:DUF4912 domain-containing protein [Adonisia turfae]NEZ62113.1 DUF4912 domain-containing protein [Adonisia turfae CCMR0082]
MSLVKFAKIIVATIAVSQVLNESFSRQNLFAQSFEAPPESFPIPNALPDGTTLKVDGSTSMRLTNEDLESRFEKQFPNVDVELDTSRTDQAFQALINGDIDILATGRPLTDAEKSQGAIEVPLEQREKLAIIIGPENGFEGDLTFDQFARIFRGDITNWSEVGGPNVPIRLVDRPGYSDTRRAFSTYNVFEGQPFTTGTIADPVSDDETESVISALGADGIGYAVASQVAERDDVTIIPMHQTLPDDPRYPYSQYRAFVYKEGASPAALAFLGFATTELGEKVPAVGDAATGLDTPTDTPTATSASGNAPTDADTSATAPGTTAADPPAGATTSRETGRFPFWLLPLLAIPLLGGLLWWLLKSGGGAPPASVAESPVQPRMVLTPRNDRHAYAYWEIPQEHLAEVKRQGGETMMLRLYDVTGRSKNSPLPTPTAELPCLESTPDLHLPIEGDGRNYCAEVGYLTNDNQWLPITKSAPIRIPVRPDVKPVASNLSELKAPKPSGQGMAGALGGAVLGGAALAGGAAALGTKLARGKAKPSATAGRMVLTPRNGQNAYAYWEIPKEHLADAQLQGGETLVAKLYDVTDRPNDAALPEPAAQVECAAADRDAHFPITSGHDYIADVGYQTASGSWLSLAQSNLVQAGGRQESTLTGNFPGAAVLGGAAAVAGAAVAGATVGQAANSAIPNSRIVMAPHSSQKAYAYWEVPETAKSALKAAGGQAYQLRIHDVTAIDIERQSPNSTLTYGLSESDCDRTVHLPNDHSEYVAEVGYQTASEDWLTLARSIPVTPSQVLTQSDNTADLADTVPEQTSPIPVAAAVATGSLSAATVKARQADPTDGNNLDTPQVPPLNQGSTQTVQVHSRNNAIMFDEGQLHHIEHNVASTYQLTSGMYTLQLRDGVFNYDADDNHPGEAFVLLWVHGGTVINQKTGVPVSSTWTTLNGYDDTLILDVRERVKICAFFLDTYPDDNSGEVTLSIVKQ